MQFELLGSPELPLAGSIHETHSFGHNGSSYLSSISLDRVLRVWDVSPSTGAATPSYSEQFPTLPICHASSLDGKSITLGMEDGFIRQLNIETGAWDSIQAHYESVRAIKWSAAGVLMTGGVDGVVLCLNMNPIKVVHNWLFGQPVYALDIVGLKWVAMLADGTIPYKDMATVADPSPVNLDPVGRDPYKPLSAQAPFPGSQCRTLRLSADGNWVVFAGSDGMLYKRATPGAPAPLWHSNPAALACFTAPDHGVWVRNDSRTLTWMGDWTYGVQLHECYAAAATHGKDGNIHIWRIATDETGLVPTASFIGSRAAPITAGSWIGGTMQYAYATEDDDIQSCAPSRMFILLLKESDFGSPSVRHFWPQADAQLGGFAANTPGNAPWNASGNFLVNTSSANAQTFQPANAPMIAPVFGPANPPANPSTNWQTNTSQTGTGNAATSWPTTTNANAPASGPANWTANMTTNWPAAAPSFNVAVAAPAIHSTWPSTFAQPSSSTVPTTNATSNNNANWVPSSNATVTQGATGPSSMTAPATAPSAGANNAAAAAPVPTQWGSTAANAQIPLWTSFPSAPLPPWGSTAAVGGSSGSATAVQALGSSTTTSAGTTSTSAAAQGQATGTNNVAAAVTGPWGSTAPTTQASAWPTPSGTLPASGTANASASRSNGQGAAAQASGASSSRSNGAAGTSGSSQSQTAGPSTGGRSGGGAASGGAAMYSSGTATGAGGFGTIAAKDGPPTAWGSS